MTTMLLLFYSGEACASILRPLCLSTLFASRSRFLRSSSSCRWFSRYAATAILRLRSRSAASACGSGGFLVRNMRPAVRLCSHFYEGNAFLPRAKNGFQDRRIKPLCHPCGVEHCQYSTASKSLSAKQPEPTGRRHRCCCMPRQTSY